MKILNAKGEPIVLNAAETRFAEINQRMCNAFGYEIDITTLTAISKKISEQKFFEVAPADFIPVVVGQGAWMSHITTYRSFSMAGAFEEGILNTGADNSRLASGDAGVDSLSTKIVNWAKTITWTLPDLEMAAKNGTWDLISAKEEQRKRNWDLGIQKIAFLGSDSDSAVKGLLNQAGVTMDTTTLTKAISSMTGAELKAFCAVVLDKYRANCNRTAWPTHFAIPESDYLGLAAPSSADFPLKSVLAVLEETFQIMTKNKAFKILPLAYADAAYSGLGYQLYTLYNYDEKSLRMDLPVSYTNTMANSLNSFQFQNVGYGSYTGVLAYRPAEILQFRF